MKTARCNYTLGAYDRCLECKYLGNGCDGPRTTSMTTERWCQWCRALKELRGYTNAYIAQNTGLSETTVERIMAGKASQDIMRYTAGKLEDFLIGSSGQWPCAMELNEGKEIVYMDSPNTIAMLTERNEQVARLRANYDDLKAHFDKETQEACDAEKAKNDRLLKEVEHLLKEVELKDKIIAKLLELQ